MSVAMESPLEIRGVLIPLQDYHLLLPNAAIAEIIDFRQPEPEEGQPGWMAGSIQWRHRKLPVVQFEHFLGDTAPQAGPRRRIMACYSQQENPQRPFVGILSRAIPRLVRVTREQLEAEPLAPGLADAPIAAALRFDGQPALIPDLAKIEQLLDQR